MNILSESEITAIYKTVVRQVDKFIVTDRYTDGVLTNQTWSVKGGFITTHPTAYEPNRMRFGYYKDISFLKSGTCCNHMSYYDEIPEPKFITDWDNLDLNHILCVYLGTDSNIYKINDPKPIKLWRCVEYIGGFCNDEYHLKPLLERLKSTPNIRNAEIISIPYYNRDEDRTLAIEFEYFGDRFSIRHEISEEFEKQFFSLEEFKKGEKHGS